MHPELLAQIARQHASEVRQIAATGARAATVARPPRPSSRNRAGRTLVHLRLRVAPR
jgi:hypothetical protein